MSQTEKNPINEAAAQIRKVLVANVMRKSMERIEKEAWTRYPRRWSGDVENGDANDHFCDGGEWVLNNIVQTKAWEELKEMVTQHSEFLGSPLMMVLKFMNEIEMKYEQNGYAQTSNDTEG